MQPLVMSRRGAAAGTLPRRSSSAVGALRSTPTCRRKYRRPVRSPRPRDSNRCWRRCQFAAAGADDRQRANEFPLGRDGFVERLATLDAGRRAGHGYALLSNKASSSRRLKSLPKMARPAKARRSKTTPQRLQSPAQRLGLRASRARGRKSVLPTRSISKRAASRCAGRRPWRRW